MSCPSLPSMPRGAERSSHQGQQKGALEPIERWPRPGPLVHSPANPLEEAEAALSGSGRPSTPVLPTDLVMSQPCEVGRLDTPPPPNPNIWPLSKGQTFGDVGLRAPGRGLQGVCCGCLLQGDGGCRSCTPALPGPGWPLQAGDFVTCCLVIRTQCFMARLCKIHLLSLHRVCLTLTVPSQGGLW